MEKAVKLLLVVAVIAAGAYGIKSWLDTKPLLQLKETVSFLSGEDYNFEAEYSIEGADVPLSDTLMTGTLKGYKSGENFFGEIIKDDETCLEIYADKSGECLFNIRPLFVYMTSFLPDILTSSIGDTYVSLEQLLEITGEESDNTWTVTDTSGDKAADYTVQYLGESEGYKMYELVLGTGETTCTIGLPENDAEPLSIEAKQGDITIVASLTVESADTDEITMPEASFSDTTIDIFEATYNLWKKLKG